MRFEQIKNKIHDASGIDNPEHYIWEKEVNGIYYPVRKMTFIDILETPELKKIVEALEWGSSDPEIMAYLKKELKDKSGWEWHG